MTDQNQTTTRRPARDVIADVISGVCSDGNSDRTRVAADIIIMLGITGYEIIPVEGQ